MFLFRSQGRATLSAEDQGLPAAPLTPGLLLAHSWPHAHSYRMSTPPHGPAALSWPWGLAPGPHTQIIFVLGDDHDV